MARPVPTQQLTETETETEAEAEGSVHLFQAAAFVENLVLRDLASAYPDAKRTPHELWYSTPGGGSVFIYPFGAVAR